jgi:hypothetical protein
LQRGLEDKDYPLVYLKAGDPNLEFSPEAFIVEEYDPKLETLRISEFGSVTLKAENGLEFIASYSTKKYVTIESIINILRTAFICVVLSLASIYFTQDS